MFNKSDIFNKYDFVFLVILWTYCVVDFFLMSRSYSHSVPPLPRS